MNARCTLNIAKEGTKLVLLGLCIYTTTDYAFPEMYIDYVKSLHGGRIISLTNIGQYLTVLTMALSLLVKNCGSTTFGMLYKELLAISFSLEGVITTMFWTLLYIDPTLVKGIEPSDPHEKVSLLTDISLHLLPFVLLLIDQIDTELAWNPWFVYHMTGFGVLYFLNIWYYSTKNKKWAYPILNDMSMPFRILFFILAMSLGMIFYLTLIIINKRIHSKKPTSL